MDDDISLPKATVHKIITEVAPPGMTCSKDMRDLLIVCCVEFIQLISTESNEIAERESRKTISGEHILKAFEDLGFDAKYVTELQELLAEHREQQKSRERKQSKLKASGLTDEELLRQQEELLEKARERYESQHEQ